MKIARYLTLIFILLLMIGVMPLPAANAQDDVQPLDDEFVSALVMMAVNHDMMAGKDEYDNLAGLHGWVSDYFDERINTAQIKGVDTKPLEDSKSQLLNSIKNKIKVHTLSGVEALDLFLTIYSRNPVENEKNYQNAKDTDPRRVVSGYKPASVNDDISEDAERNMFNALYSSNLLDFGDTVNNLFNINISANYPSLAPVVTDSSDWSYYAPSISGSSADFWDQSGDDDDSGSSSSGSNGSPDTIDVHKPIRFINNGFEPVTVVVESYEPAPGLNPAVSSASTVVFPESNSSAYLDLPQGTYTFCYYWQLDTDFNNDDYFDYHHRSTSAVTLNENSSSIPESAITVALNPDGTVSNPNGKCGGGYADAGIGDLTPAEAANAGTHTYHVTCEGSEYCEGESDLFTFTISFGEASFTLTGEGENEYFTRVGENQYTWSDGEGEIYTLIFTTDGFYYYWDFFEVILYYTLTDRPDAGVNTPLVSNSTDEETAISGLTPEEAANEGIHTYLRWCDDSSKGSDYVTYINTFSDSSFSLETEYGDIQRYSYSGENQYLMTDNVGSYTLTFTSDGWTLYFHNYSNYCYFKLQD